MTAIAFGTTTPAHADVVSTRLHLTARGRRVLAILVALPLALVLGMAIVGGGAALASRDAGVPAGTFETVTVAAGDTLWSIAERVAPGSDPRDVVAEIQKLNALPDSTLAQGQRIAIPLAYTHH